MPIRRSSPSSRRSPIAGGIPAANFGRCTRSIRCGSAGSNASPTACADKAILDVGCGGGILAEAMASAGARVTGIDLSEKALGVAQLHRLESGRRRRLPADRGRGARRGNAGAVRYRHVHGNAGARAGSGLHHHGVRGVGETRRHARLLDAQPQPEVVCVRDPRRRIPVAIAAARHARLDQVPASVGARGLCAARRSRSRPDDRHDLQPADARLSARSRHLRQLPRGLPQTCACG